ncbi:MAG: hypothetical protein QXY52_05960 [Conexivisphaerales archaeon]
MEQERGLTELVSEGAFTLGSVGHPRTNGKIEKFNIFESFSIQ